jgi:negative regulator of sigma E activity
MTDPVKEQLSACVDGELAEAELDLLLRQVQRQPQLREAMGRYALVGEALRGQRPVRASAGFADRVAAAVAAEQISETASPSRRTAPRWLQPVAGLGVAAAVAAVTVMAFRPTALDPEQVAANSSTAASESEATAPSYTVPTHVDSTAGSLIPAARLTNYVVAHSEFSSPLGRRTVLSGVLSDDDTSEIEPNGEELDVRMSGTPDPSAPMDGSSR